MQTPTKSPELKKTRTQPASPVPVDQQSTQVEESQVTPGADLADVAMDVEAFGVSYLCIGGLGGQCIYIMCNYKENILLYPTLIGVFHSDLQEKADAPVEVVQVPNGNGQVNGSEPQDNKRISDSYLATSFPFTVYHAHTVTPDIEIEQSKWQYCLRNYAYIYI